MIDLVGRKIEQQELEEAYASKEAEFIAVYGRRRVGKTYLIKNFFEKKKCLFLQVVGIYKGTLNQQLVQFSQSIGNAFYGGAQLSTMTGWMSAFEQLTQAIEKQAKNKKIVLFFDELPWLANKKSGMISALEYFWNRHWVHDKRIKLIVCGSAASWILKKIIKNKGGLHNRVTRRLRLLPFTLHETHLYLKYLGYPATLLQTTQLYMAMGGIPFYLQNIKRNLSVDQNINKLFFDPTSLFFDEFDEVFASLFDSADQYRELVTLIASSRTGIARKIIDKKNKLTGKGGRLSHRLEDLENAGFVKRYIPVGHKKRGYFYHVSDEYCLFYLKWIKPIKDQLKNESKSYYWKSIVGTPEYYSWLGYAFESLCFKHIKQIKAALDIDDASFASPWQLTAKNSVLQQGVQIDLLFNGKSAEIVLCEIKYTDKLFIVDKRVSEDLLKKAKLVQAQFGINKQIFTALITPVGMKLTPYTGIIAKCVTLKALGEE